MATEVNTDRELNTPEDDEIFGELARNPINSSTEGPTFAKRSAAEEVTGWEAILTPFQENMTQHQHESSEELEGGPRFKSQTNGEIDTDTQNEEGERQVDADFTSEILENMIQHQHESSEELECGPQFKSQTSGETDTDTQNEEGERQVDADFVCVFSGTGLSSVAEKTKCDTIPVENCAPYDTTTTEACNRSSEDLADVIHKEGISKQILLVSSTETGGYPVIKKGDELHMSEPIQGNQGCSDSASIQSGIPMTNTCIQESTDPIGSTLQFGDNESSFIQPELSAPSTSTTPTNRYNGDLSQESEVGTKRKNSEKDTINKKFKGTKSMQSEEERRRKNAEKSRQNRKRNKEEVESLRKKIETLQKQIKEKNCIIANLTRNRVSENANNPQSASAENKLDEEFTEMMHQANVEAFDPEKFLKLMNNWFRSKGMSKIRVLHDKEPTAGVVRVEKGEQKMKIRVLAYYRKMESDKERYNKCKEDHERNGLA